MKTYQLTDSKKTVNCYQKADLEKIAASSNTPKTSGIANGSSKAPRTKGLAAAARASRFGTLARASVMPTPSISSAAAGCRETSAPSVQYNLLCVPQGMRDRVHLQRRMDGLNGKRKLAEPAQAYAAQLEGRVQAAWFEQSAIFTLHRHQGPQGLPNV